MVQTTSAGELSNEYIKATLRTENHLSAALHYERSYSVCNFGYCHLPSRSNGEFIENLHIIIIY